jgi:hypothetical protein
LEQIPGIGAEVGLIDGIFQRLTGTIQQVESASPVSGGVLKSDIVNADFVAGLSTTQAILALSGKTLNYDKVALQDAINSQVAAYNAMAKLKTSFAIVALPVTPAK